MLPFGTFKVFHVTHDGTGFQYRPIARFVYAQTGTQVVEDVTGTFRQRLPDGPLDAAKQRFLDVLPTWSYYHIVEEQPTQPV
jgi:hypothetical protein